MIFFPLADYLYLNIIHINFVLRDDSAKPKASITKGNYVYAVPLTAQVFAYLFGKNKAVVRIHLPEKTAVLNTAQTTISQVLSELRPFTIIGYIIYHKGPHPKPPNTKPSSTQFLNKATYKNKGTVSPTH